MTKNLLVALVSAVAFASPAAAVRAGEVKYTMHLEAKAAANAASDPMSAMVGGMVSQMFPPGGIDQVVIAGEKGMRSEQKQEFAGMKAGTVTIVKADGTQYMLDPPTKTYWKVPAVPAEMTAMMSQMNPKITVGKGGVFETIAGMKCEKISIGITMPIPGVDPSQLPPGMPTEISLAMDMWLTDAVKVPVAAAEVSMGALKQFGFDQIPELKKLSTDGRMMVKGVMSMFGVEMIMEARNITTVAAAPELFEIPKDYKEVPAPGGGVQALSIR